MKMYDNNPSTITDHPKVYLYERKAYADAAYTFADAFNERLGTTHTYYSSDGICKTNGSTNIENLNKAWNGATVGKVKSLKTIYTEKRDALNEEDKAEFDLIFTSTTANPTGSVIQITLSLYEHLVSNRGLEDFIHSISRRATVLTNKLNIYTLSNLNNNTAVIIIISFVSLIASSGIFLIRKNKKV